MNKSFYLLLKLLTVFSILFDINSTLIPGITTARITFIILLITTLKNKKLFPKTFLYFMFFLVLITSFAIIQSFISFDFTQVSRLFWFIVYGIISPYLFINYIKNKNEFFYLVSIAVVFQAILSILSYLNPTVKQIFNNLIIYTTNFDKSITLRAMGFASIGGSSLSIIQSSGIISLLIILKSNTSKTYNIILIWIGILIILISILFIGRTGLFISIFAILIYFISKGINIKNCIITALIFVVASHINYLNIIKSFTGNIKGFKSELFIDWIQNSFQIKGNKTKEDLFNMPVPPITFYTIIGTGRVIKKIGIGNASGHDSGYIQTYYSLGLILSIIFYVSYLYFLLFNSKKQKILYLLIVITFFIEIKEPFIFHYSFPFFILSSILIFGKNINENSIQKLD